MATMQQAQGCLHENYNVALRALFRYMKQGSATRRQVEAAALDQIGRQVRAGLPFCSAYGELIPWVRARIDNHVYKDRPPNWADEPWLVQTRAHLDNNASVLLERCHALERDVPNDAPGKLNGVLSPAIRCINGHRKEAAASFILDQYTNEEI